MSDLTTVRSINTATQFAAMGKGGYVFCIDQAGVMHRIIRARSEYGTLLVLSINNQWIPEPRRVWQEGK